MSVKKVEINGSKYYRAGRMINREVYQKYFPPTLAGEKKALRYDNELSKIQKQSRAKNNTYIRSKYGFIRGLCISHKYSNGRLITEFKISLRRPDGHWHMRQLDVRAGRTFRGCFDILIEEIIEVLKVSKYTRATPGFKQLIANTYKYMRARENARRLQDSPMPVKRVRKNPKGGIKNV